MITMWLLLFALQTSPAPAAQTGTIPVDARAAIDRANTDWLPAMKRQDAKTIAEAYADEGVFVSLPPPRRAAMSASPISIRRSSRSAARSSAGPS